MEAFLPVAVGLLGLVAGGETLARRAASAARSFGISPMVIGLTLVGLGTSTPELLTGVRAAPGGSRGIAVGNIVGSNIGNELLILGTAALMPPVAVDPHAFRRDGAVVVAIGTSMPELVTSVIAVRKGQGDVALGNVLGSNLFNILGILGVTALVQPMAIPAEIARLDIWVMCGATAVLMLFARTGWTIDRREGAVFVLAYGAYLSVLLLL